MYVQKCYWAEPHFTGLNWNMNAVVVLTLSKIYYYARHRWRCCTSQAMPYTISVQVAYEYLMFESKCLHLDYNPALTERCLGELFLRPSHFCTSVIKLISSSLTKKETITGVSRSLILQ